MGSFCSSCEREEKKTDAIIEPKTVTVNGAEGEFLLPPDNALQRANSLYHPLAISRQYSLTFNSQNHLDFSTRDYRAFCLLIHRKHGALLLHCTRKKKKPPHYQLPGGHIDHCEFKQIRNSLSTRITKEQLYHAARVGCAREVYEETGIDFRSRLGKLLPMILYNTEENNFKGDTLINEYKSRIFFVCELFDEDFPYRVRTKRRANISFRRLVLNEIIYYIYRLYSKMCLVSLALSLQTSSHKITQNQERDGSMRFSSTRFPSLPSDFSCDLMLQLSVEHSGFRFFKESSEISNSLKYHSGGKVQEAVTMAYKLIN
mmetsp:Transcript_8895/g.21978  ORF Transcript_8895/g.21978 Transcript_8895/m.21978 type:complete len:316 (+) Transcript_8895:110-1057(+)